MQPTSEANAATSTPTNDAGETQSTDSTALTQDVTAAPATESQAPTTDDQQQQAADTKAETPETYDLQMPEGVELDKDAAAEFVAIAKSLELSQENAQKLATIAGKIQQKQAEARARQVESWVEEVKADKDLGGDKLEENLGVARKALETFGSPELKDVLNASGLGNHPAVIRAFFKAGKAISDDGFVRGSAPRADSNDPAKKMFPNMN